MGGAARSGPTPVQETLEARLCVICRPRPDRAGAPVRGHGVARAAPRALGKHCGLRAQTEGGRAHRAV
eukprot:1143075-Lingulodinium_polyedra.AAC.1